MGFVSITDKNDRILEYIHLLGYSTVAKFSRASGLHATSVGWFINNKRSPVNETGEWSVLAVALSDALACEPNDIWPDAKRISGNHHDDGCIEEAIDVRHIDPESAVIIRERDHLLHSMLDGMTPRETQVLKMRCGIAPYDNIWSLDEIAVLFDLSRERVRQIEASALRRIRSSFEMRRLGTIISNTEWDTRIKRGITFGLAVPSSIEIVVNTM